MRFVGRVIVIIIMPVSFSISGDKEHAGLLAARNGAEIIRRKLDESPSALVSIILATGASQFEMLGELVQSSGIDWTRVTCFHLDEYVGLAEDHKASFRGYLKARFLDLLPENNRPTFHFVGGTQAGDGSIADAEAESEIARLGDLIGAREIEVAFIGIGENGHLAFSE